MQNFVFALRFAAVILGIYIFIAMLCSDGQAFLIVAAPVTAVLAVASEVFNRQFCK